MPTGRRNDAHSPRGRKLEENDKTPANSRDLLDRRVSFLYFKVSKAMNSRKTCTRKR